MPYTLLTTFYIFFAIFSWRRLPWAVLFVIAALPSYLIRFHLGPVPMTFLEGMVIIVFVAWLIQRLSSRQARTTSRRGSIQVFFERSLESCRETKSRSMPIALFLFAATISIFIAPDLRAAAGIWKAYFIEPVLFFIILLDLLIHHPNLLNRRQIIAALSVSAFLLSLYAIFQRFTGFGIPPPWDKELRVTSIFPYPNALGLFLGPLIPLFIVQVVKGIHALSYDRKKVRGLIVHGYWLIISGLSLVAIVFAKSTGALVGIGAGLFVMGFLLIYKNKKVAIGYLALAICATALLLVVPAVRNELLLRDWSGHVRRTQWSETWQMLQDRPILGAGLAGYKEALAPYHEATYLEIFEYPHNIVLNFWSEIGLLGLLAFAWLMVVLFRHTLKSVEIVNWKLEIPTMASMIVILVHGLVDVPYFKNDLAIIFWIIYALGLTNGEKSENIQSPI